jgi:nucleoside-diphosphate-sugar epimerase
VKGTVLVTGGSGFVGRHVLSPLVAAGFDVHTLGRRPVGVAGVRHHSGDLLDRRCRVEALAAIGPSHIVHLAWTVEHGRFWTAPENLDWVAATLDLAPLAAASGVRRFVGVGTCMEYDWSDGARVPRREDDPLGPTSIYAEAKAATFRVLRRFFAEQGVGFAWGRLFHLFGPGEPPARLVPSVVTALRAGRPAEIGSGTQVRDYMAVEAAGQALAALAASPVEGPVNIATGEAVTIGDVARAIAALIGRPDLLRIGARADPKGDVPVMVADVHRLKDEVGFDPGGRGLDALEGLLGDRS